MSETGAPEGKEIEITTEMAAAGERVLQSELGGAVTVFWNPRDLAISVFQAMISAETRHED